MPPRRHLHQIILACSHQLGLDQGADLVIPLGREVGRVGSVDDLERLVITGGGGELFKPRLRDQSCLDVSPCGKLKKASLRPA